MSEMSITIFWRACFQVRWVFVWTWGAFEALPHKQVGCFFIPQDLHEPDGFTKEGRAGAAWNTPNLVAMEGGRRTLTCRTWEAPLPSSPCPVVEFGTNGKCGEAQAGWLALCYPSSPCLPLSLQSTSHSESNTEPQRRDAARFRITPPPHLPTGALWSRFLDPPVSSRLWVRGKRRENCNLLPLLACWLLLAALHFYSIEILTVGLHKYEMIAL